MWMTLTASSTYNKCLQHTIKTESFGQMSLRERPRYVNTKLLTWVSPCPKVKEIYCLTETDPIDGIWEHGRILSNLGSKLQTHSKIPL